MVNQIDVNIVIHICILFITFDYQKQILYSQHTGDFRTLNFNLSQERVHLHHNQKSE